MKKLRATDPATIADWTLLGRLGEGGQGVVFLAEHATDTEQPKAAIKLFKETDTKFLAKELDAITALSGAVGCAQILATGSYEDQPWIATTYVDGPDLFTSVTDAGPIQGELLTTLAVATCTALAAIHRAGVVHRDFKPSNVLLGPDGPVVIDFGVAHVLESAGTTSNIVGTPSYAAPEQLAGHKAAAAADVFSWACTMTFAATGIPPFGADSIPAVMQRIMFAPPYLDGVPRVLQPLLWACLHKDPVMRPAAEQVVAQLLTLADPETPTGEDMLGAARTFIHTKVMPAPTPAPTRGRGRWFTRRDALVVAGVTGGGLALAAVLLGSAVLANSPGAGDGGTAAAAISSSAAPPTGAASAARVPALPGQAEQTATPSLQKPQLRDAAQIMDAIGREQCAHYSHDLVIPQGTDRTESSGRLCFHPGGATDYASQVQWPGNGSSGWSYGSATIIGNTAYDSTGRSWDLSPGQAGPSDEVWAAVEARRVSSPYTIQALLESADSFQLDGVSTGMAAVSGSMPTSRLVDGPTGDLFKEVIMAPTTTFRLVFDASSYLPSHLEMRMEVPGVGAATATADWYGWSPSVGPISP